MVDKQGEIISRRLVLRVCSHFFQLSFAGVIIQILLERLHL